jgi:23S rRNA pseudouridine2605 synthase
MERLQKILARAGFGSRRYCEELIQNGRVKVNNQIATLGSKALPDIDHITVDGQKITLPSIYTYIALNKPRGILSAVSSPDRRYKTVIDLVDLPIRLFPIGRLDVDSEGLIILTDDGALTNILTHPRYEHEKEYRVLINGIPDPKHLANWRKGVTLSDGSKTKPAKVTVEHSSTKNTWLRIILREGQKKQIRETAKVLGLQVLRIIRIRIHTLNIGKLKSGEWRYLSDAEIALLKG